MNFPKYKNFENQNIYGLVYKYILYNKIDEDSLRNSLRGGNAPGNVSFRFSFFVEAVTFIFRFS